MDGLATPIPQHSPTQPKADASPGQLAANSPLTTHTTESPPLSKQPALEPDPTNIGQSQLVQQQTHHTGAAQTTFITQECQAQDEADQTIYGPNHEGEHSWHTKNVAKDRARQSIGGKAVFKLPAAGSNEPR